MKSLFEKDAVNEILQRIDNLQPTSPRKWGKMDVAQMMAHCSAALEVAVGHKSPPRLFIGRILGPFFKLKFIDDTPYPKNGPTDKSFIVADKRDFEKEKTTLKTLIKQFADGGAEKCTLHPHSFFGKLTAEQWSLGMYKHLDHHLQQFEV
jgi:uncharacterized protein DUF1569